MSYILQPPPIPNHLMHSQVDYSTSMLMLSIPCSRLQPIEYYIIRCRVRGLDTTLYS